MKFKSLFDLLKIKSKEEFEFSFVDCIILVVERYKFSLELSISLVFFKEELSFLSVLEPLP